MNDLFKIYILRLKEGRAEKIDEKFDPGFIEISDEELSFKHPVFVKGEASFASDTLILKFRIETIATMPCSICNQDAEVPIVISDFQHTENQEEIKGDVFDYSGIIREAILLEIPLTVECSGNCPEREALAQFFASRKREEDDKYHPFENL